MVYYDYMIKPTLHIRLFVTFLFVISFGVASHGDAAEYRCEVMTIQGTAYVSDASQVRRAVKEGDTLGGGDILETNEGSWVDLAYDPLWNNVTRIGEKSIVRIAKVYPGKLHVDKGSVLAQFENLPKNSKFEVVTPTAVAAVRGTSFKVSHDAMLGTQVSNLSKSKVEVYRIDPSGVASGKSLYLDFGQALKMPGLYAPDSGVDTPEHIPGAEFKSAKQTLDEIQARVKEIQALGKTAQIVRPPDQGLAVTDTENWRVKYLKRQELEDATYFDPSTTTAGVVEANMEFTPDQMFCLEKGAGAELQNTKTGESYFVAGPFAAPTQKIPEAGNGAPQEYSKTKVLALEGSVQTANYLPGANEDVKVSEVLLEAGKPFAKSGGPVNESEVTPCGYMKKVKNNCQNQVKEYEWAWGEIEKPDFAKQYDDPPPLALPKPQKRASLDGQHVEE